jgi:hypothetical protein
MNQTDERPSKMQINLRIRPDLKAGIERLAEQKGIPYQTLIHTWLMERYYDEMNQTVPNTDPNLVMSIERAVERSVEQALGRIEQVLTSRGRRRAVAT